MVQHISMYRTSLYHNRERANIKLNIFIFLKTLLSNLPYVGRGKSSKAIIYDHIMHAVIVLRIIVILHPYCVRTHGRGIELEVTTGIHCPYNNNNNNNNISS